ncbi:MAG: serine protease [Elusimicrobiales bacterium]|jgi:hypothetical protein
MRTGFLVTGFLALTLFPQEHAGPRAQNYADPNFRRAGIIGKTDDRREPREVAETRKKLSESTVALFHSNNLRTCPNGEVVITRAFSLDLGSGIPDLCGATRPLTLEQREHLRPGERFGQQISAAFGSGVLIGEDLILTAAHLFETPLPGKTCEGTMFVFGFAAREDGSTPRFFPEKDVYTCRKIVVHRLQNHERNSFCVNGECKNYPMDKLADLFNPDALLGPDYAIIKLDRKVENHAQLLISRIPVKTGDKLFMIGYPGGIPVKVTENGSVLSANGNGYFTTDLDTFGGNSGSPVFDAETLKIAGVFVRSSCEDYRGGKTNHCRFGDDHVTSSTEFMLWPTKITIKKEMDRPKPIPAVYFPRPVSTTPPLEGI